VIKASASCVVAILLVSCLRGSCQQCRSPTIFVDRCGDRGVGSVTDMMLVIETIYKYSESTDTHLTIHGQKVV
jgi:hypothetical protein